MESYRNASKNTMFVEWLDATKKPQSSEDCPPSPSDDGSPTGGEQLKFVDVMQYLAEGKVGNPDPSQIRYTP